MKRSSTSPFNKLALRLVICAGAAVLHVPPAFAASCCGGSFAAPTIINGDDRAQLTASFGYTQVAIANVDADGMWYSAGRERNTRTLKLEGAHLLHDRWQAGFSIPVITRSAPHDGSNSSSGLGDVATDIAYEFLPDWDYSPYRPKGIGFFTLTLPTGKSKIESEVGGLDSRGTGFTAVGLGALLSKVLGRWDILVSPEAHRSFEKPIATSQLQGSLQPGFGGSLALGGGYSFLPAWRAGGSLTWVYEDAIALSNAAGTVTMSGLERYATAALTLGHVDGEEWAETITFTDQTLFGAPVNTSLGRGIMAQLQRRWGR